MPPDPAFYSMLRKDFESLQPQREFSLVWTSRPELGVNDELLPSQWTWYDVPDESLRRRLSVLALKGARALGHDSEDAWFDELRKADFVKFKITGCARCKRPDGTIYDWESGKLGDVIKHSITLLYVLESRAEMITQPEDAAHDWTHGAGAERIKTKGKGRKRGPKPDAKMALRVAQIVPQVAPDGDWRSKLDEVCDALDEAQIPCPSRWRKKRHCQGWCDYDDREIAVKAIEYRLGMAEQLKKAPSETLS